MTLRLAMGCLRSSTPPAWADERSTAFATDPIYAGATRHAGGACNLFCCVAASITSMVPRAS